MRMSRASVIVTCDSIWFPVKMKGVNTMKHDGGSWWLFLFFSFFLLLLNERGRGAISKSQDISIERCVLGYAKKVFKGMTLGSFLCCTTPLLACNKICILLSGFVPQTAKPRSLSPSFETAAALVFEYPRWFIPFSFCAWSAFYTLRIITYWRETSSHVWKIEAQVSSTPGL